MYKPLHFLCIVSCLLYYYTIFSDSVFSRSNEWLSFNSKQDSNALIKINITESTNHNLRFQVNVPGATISQRSEKDQKYQIINIPGCLPLNNIGKPLLPRLIKCIAIPASCTTDDIDIQIVSREFRISEGYEVTPVPKRIKRKTSNGIIYFDEEYLKDKETYSANRFYPNELIRVEKIGFIRDQKVMWLSINPVQYNPVTLTLKTFSSIDVHLTFKGDIIFKQSSLGPLDQFKKDLFLNNQLSTENIISYPTHSGQVTYPDNLLDQTNSADYLVIITDDLVTNTSLDSFAHHKANFNGFNVAVVKIGDIYQQFPDTTYDASIKDFLVYAFYKWQAHYFADNHLGYVLLVGEGNNQSNNVIPIPRYKSNNGWVQSSDHWYACINDDNGDGRFNSPNDNIADFIIGRFSVENHQELADVTQKTINYEKNLSNGGSWRKKILLVNGFYEVEGDSSTKVLFDELETMTLEQNYYEIVSRLDRTEMDPSFVSNSFIQQINDGCALINVCAHGSVDVWGDARGWILFKTSDIYSLNNIDKQPIILSFSCNTADISDSLQDCLAENFLYAPNKGAIAFWGAPIPTGHLSNNFLCRTIYENILKKRNTSLGLILYFTNFLGNWSYSNYFRNYNILGDPSLSFDIKTEHLPDLSISPNDISVDWSPIVGNSETIAVKVNNLGYQAAQDVVVQFFDGNPTQSGHQIGTDRIINIIERLGDYQNAEVPIEDVISGELNVFVRVDPYDQITEMDETNNVASILDKEPVFFNIASTAAVADTGRSWATAFGDYNDDGHLDIFVANWPQPNMLYRNEGNNLFQKIMLHSSREDSLIDLYDVTPTQTTFIDYDNDGDLDIYYKYCYEIGGYYEIDLFCPDKSNIIYRNDGDDIFTSSKIITENGKTITERVFGFFDYNQDGLLDIICSNEYDATILLYQKNSNGTYTDVTSKAGLNSTSDVSSLSFGDYNNDGYIDFYQITSEEIPNILYKNIVNEFFVDVTNKAGLKEITGWATFCDYNNDGHLDVFENAYTSINLYKNNKNGTFSNLTSNIGLDSIEYSWGFPAFIDYNNDGYQDLCLSSHSDMIYKNSGRDTFLKVPNAVKEKRNMGKAGLTAGDYDNDGDLDIYMAVTWSRLIENYREKEIPPANSLYRNKGNNNNWLVIKLKGNESNSFGIGSRVRVVSDKLVQIRDVTCEVTNFQNSLSIEIGLGEDNQIDTVEVRWPSGVNDVLTDVSVNQIITIEEGYGDYSFRQVYSYQLSQNFPNPFNTTTNFLYTIASNMPNPESTVEVTIRIYNMLGQKVRTMVLGSQKAGQHAFTWDGYSDNNRQLPSGIYFYQIKAGEFVQTKKMLLLK